MAKLSIVAAPTFKAPVSIPVAGSTPIDVEFTFKHRTKDELAAFLSSREGRSDAEALLEMASGWDFCEALTPESVETMLQNYIGAAVAIYKKYIEELSQAKVKN
jgi:hypothetical protein